MSPGLANKRSIFYWKHSGKWERVQFGLSTTSAYASVDNAFHRNCHIRYCIIVFHLVVCHCMYDVHRGTGGSRYKSIDRSMSQQCQYPNLSQQPEQILRPVKPRTLVFVLYWAKSRNAPTITTAASSDDNADSKEEAITRWITTSFNDIKPGTSVKVLNRDLTIWRSYSIAVDIRRDLDDGSISTS